MKTILINGKRFEQANLVDTCVVIEDGIIISFNQPEIINIDDT
jgi:hypothetical protein